MKLILRVSITLICFLEIVAGINNSTQKSTTVRGRSSKVFKVRYNESRKLISLHVAISQLMATHIPRETFVPTKKYCHHQRHTRRKEYHITWNRPTKSTTKKAYSRREAPYPTHLERRKMIYRHFVNVFSGFDEKKKAFLTKMEKSIHSNTDCYMEVSSRFMRRCFYEYYTRFTGVKYIRNLLSKACEADWLNVNKIIRVIEGCCGDKFKYDVFPNLF